MLQVPAWLSASDVCFLSGSPGCHGEDEYIHYRGLVSHAEVALLWADGRGKDSNGAPLLALDGRFVFVRDVTLAVSGALLPFLGTLFQTQRQRELQNQVVPLSYYNHEQPQSKATHKEKSIPTSHQHPQPLVEENISVDPSGMPDLKVTGDTIWEQVANLGKFLSRYYAYLNSPQFIRHMLSGVGLTVLVVSSIAHFEQKEMKRFASDFKHCKGSSLGAFIQNPCAQPPRSCSTRALSPRDASETKAILEELARACHNGTNPAALSQQRECAEALEHLSYRDEQPRHPGMCALTSTARQACVDYGKLIQVAEEECRAAQDPEREQTLYDMWSAGRRAGANARRNLVLDIDPHFTNRLHRQVYRAGKLFRSPVRTKTLGVASNRGLTRDELQRFREQARRLALREAAARKSIARSALRSAWSTLGHVPRKLFFGEPVLQHFRETFVKNRTAGLGRDLDASHACAGKLHSVMIDNISAAAYASGVLQNLPAELEDIQVLEALRAAIGCICLWNAEGPPREGDRMDDIRAATTRLQEAYSSVADQLLESALLSSLAELTALLDSATVSPDLQGAFATAVIYGAGIAAAHVVLTHMLRGAHDPTLRDYYWHCSYGTLVNLFADIIKRSLEVVTIVPEKRPQDSAQAQPVDTGNCTANTDSGWSTKLEEVWKRFEPYGTALASLNPSSLRSTLHSTIYTCATMILWCTHTQTVTSLIGEKKRLSFYFRVVLPSLLTLSRGLVALWGAYNVLKFTLRGEPSKIIALGSKIVSRVVFVVVPVFNLLHVISMNVQPKKARDFVEMTLGHLLAYDGANFTESLPLGGFLVLAVAVLLVAFRCSSTVQEAVASRWAKIKGPPARIMGQLLDLVTDALRRESAPPEAAQE